MPLWPRPNTPWRTARAAGTLDDVTAFVLRLLSVSALAVVSTLIATALLGSVSLALSGSDDAGARPTIALTVHPAPGVTLGRDGMMPGDSVTGAFEIRNDGGDELRYAITAVPVANGARDLASALTLTVRTADSGATAGDPTDDNLCDEATGTVLRGPALIGSSHTVVGDASAGPHRGDRVLAAGATEVLCLTVELPITTGNEYQGASTVLTVGFASEATADNP